MSSNAPNPSKRSRQSLQRAFGARLKTLRKAKGLNQEELAHRIGMSVDLISGMERGIAFGSFETLVKLARELDCSLAVLFEIEPASEANSDAARIAALLSGQPQIVLAAAEAQVKALIELSTKLTKNA